MSFSRIASSSGSRTAPMTLRRTIERTHRSASFSALQMPTEAPMLDFLYPSFGFFSRSLPAKSDSTAATTSCPRRPMTRVGKIPKCSCGRPKLSCLHCRAASSAAAVVLPQLAPSAPSIPDPQIPTPRKRTPPDRPTKRHALLNLVSRYDKELPSVRGRAPHHRRQALPLAERITQANDLWEAVQAFDGWQTLEGTTQLDIIRLFARLPRDVLEDEHSDPKAFTSFRKQCADTIETLLARSPAAREHSKSWSLLVIDTFVLRDAVPSTARLALRRTGSAFKQAFCAIFESAEPDKGVLQARLTALSALFEAFERSDHGSQEAFDLVTGWQLDSLWRRRLRIRSHDQEQGYADLFQRRYGRLLAKLKPSPASFSRTMHPDAIPLAAHLIDHLATADHASQAYAVYEVVKDRVDAYQLSALYTLLKALSEKDMVTRATTVAKTIRHLIESTTLADTPLRERDLAELDAIERQYKSDATSGSVLEQARRRPRGLETSDDFDAIEASFEHALVNESQMHRQQRYDHYAGYAKLLIARNRLEKAMDIVNRMRSNGLVPKRSLLQAMLFGFAERVDAQATYALFDRLPRFGIRQDAAAYNALLLLHKNAKDPEAARHVLHKMRTNGIKPTVREYTTLIDALVESGRWRSAFALFEHLEKADDPDLQPDTAAVNTIIKAAAGNSAPTPVVLDMFKRAVSRGLLPDQHTYTLLLQCFCRAGQMAAAEQLFSLMQRSSSTDQPDSQDVLPVPLKPIKPDAFHFSTLMHGYLLQNDFSNARACLQEMQNRGLPISSVTYGIIVDSFLRTQSEQGMSVAVSLAREFVRDSDDTATTLMTKEDRPAVRGEALANILQPIVNAYARRAQAREALRFFRLVVEDADEEGEPTGRMRERRRTPPVSLYTALMKAYRRLEDVDEVRYLWEYVSRAIFDTWRVTSTSSSSSTVDSFHATDLCMPLSLYLDSLSLVDGPTALAQAMEEWTWLSERGFAFDSANWNDLAIAACRADQVERALSIIEDVLLDPETRSIATLTPWSSASRPTAHSDSRATNQASRTDIARLGKGSNPEDSDDTEDQTSSLSLPLKTMLDAQTGPTGSVFKSLLSALNEAMGRHRAEHGSRTSRDLLAAYPKAFDALDKYRSEVKEKEMRSRDSVMSSHDVVRSARDADQQMRTR